MMKMRVLFTLLLVTTILVLVGCNGMQEREAEKLMSVYYEALIDGDFEHSVEVLHLHDQVDNPYAGTSKDSNAAIAISKANFEQLENLGYQITSYEISALEYEDGHSFWHHVQVIGEMGSESFMYEDTVQLFEEKLVITSEDPFVQYRNGHLATY